MASSLPPTRALTRSSCFGVWSGRLGWVAGVHQAARSAAGGAAGGARERGNNNHLRRGADAKQS
jgi:hypothetical protein